MERKSEKSGYLLIKMVILLKIYTKTLNSQDFCHKNSQSQRFYAEYTENSGYSMRFFQKIGKFTVSSTKLTIKPNKGGNLSQVNFCKTIHNYCRKHQKFAKFACLHNTTQIGEKLSPIVSKIGIFLKCHINCSSYKAQIAHTQITKAAINCSYVYCEEIHGKCYKHIQISSKCTIVVTGVSKSTNIHAQNTIQTKLANIGITI